MAVTEAEMEAQRGHALWQCLMAIPGQPEVLPLRFLPKEPEDCCEACCCWGYMAITSSTREGVQGFFLFPPKLPALFLLIDNSNLL